MKIVNVKAYSVNDVRKNSPFQLVKNATTMWRKAGSHVAGEELKTFMREYLAKETKNFPGQGCYIVVDSAVSDSRENPYKIHNIPTEGKRKFKRVPSEWFGVKCSYREKLTKSEFFTVVETEDLNASKFSLTESFYMNWL